MTNGRTNQHAHEVTQALMKVLGYLEEAERADYEATPEPERAGHIYESIKTLRAMLNPEEESEEPRDAESFEALKRERKTRRGTPLFELGRTVATPGSLESLTGDDVLRALCRHVNGDWGDVCQEDWEENELSIKEGFRLLSVYHGRNGTKFWVITEADRSATTVLLPEEY